MFLVKKLLSAWILSPAGLGVVVIVGLIAYARGHRRLSALFCGGAGMLLIALSLPFVSRGLMQSVELPPPSSKDFAGAQAVVVLGGGIHRGAAEYGVANTLSSATLARIRYGAWLAKHYRLPILVSGGGLFDGPAEAQLMANALREEFGVSARWVESASRDTSENAAFSAKLLTQDGVHRIALVSHAYHLRRASAAFSSQGLSIVAAPTLSSISPDGFETWLPSASSLDDSFIAIHEWVGLLVSKTH